jgi:sarcosine oxidase subunit alpha
MRHLDWAKQTAFAGRDVRFTSVTEQWAQFAVAGPKSRELLNGLLDQPISDADFPFMACAEVALGGVQGRLFRISFSGEHAYEIAVPARYGASLFDALVARARALGGGAYGMEALNVLRIEKGHITHAEIHGRVTAYDIGFGKMLKKDGDFIGKMLAQRPGLLDPQRERMVGLRPVDRGALTAGAHLFPKGAWQVQEHDLGYVTSVGYSPTLGEMRGLGFVKNGPARIGDRLMLVDAVRGVETLVELTDPVAFDARGGRLRG